MPIYNPYNEVVQPAKFVAPLDLNLLLKGTQYKQEQSEKNFNEIQGQVNNLLSIPAYGKDKEILNQKLQELQQVMGGLDVTNLETPQAKQQINSLINQFSQDKDVQAVAQRGNSYQNMMAEKQDFDKKGKVYMNQGLRKLNQYYSGDDYIRDVKFSNYGYEAPDAGKIMEEVKKIVTPSKKQVPGLNGTMQEIEEYEPKALQKAFEAITNSMPTYKQSLIDNLDNSLEGQDVNELAIKKYQPLLAQYQQNETNAMWLASQTSDPALKTKYLNDAQSAREGINLAQQVLQNPYSGLAYKQAELSSLMNQDLKNMTDALTFHKEGERKMTDVAKMNAEHAHDFNLLAAQQAKEIAVKTELARLGLTSDGSSLSRPDYDAFQNIVSSSQTRMTDDYKMFSDELQNIGDYTGDNPTYLKDKKVIPFTAIPSVIQNVILDFDVVKNSLKNGEKLTGIIVDESDPSNKKYIPVVSNSSGTNFKVAKNSGQDVVVDDNSIKMKTLAVKKEKIPGSNLPQTQDINNTQYGEIELEDGSKVKAVILPNPSDTSSLKPGEYAIVNGQPFLK